MTAFVTHYSPNLSSTTGLSQLPTVLHVLLKKAAVSRPAERPRKRTPFAKRRPNRAVAAVTRLWLGPLTAAPAQNSSTDAPPRSTISMEFAGPLALLPLARVRP